MESPLWTDDILHDFSHVELVWPSRSVHCAGGNFSKKREIKKKGCPGNGERGGHYVQVEKDYVVLFERMWRGHCLVTTDLPFRFFYYAQRRAHQEPDQDTEALRYLDMASSLIRARPSPFS